MKKVLFFGDSNTYGYDPAGYFGGRYPRAQRWTTILQECLADDWKISDDGLPGRAIPVTRREWEILGGYVRSEMPLDLFAVMLGTNDLLSTIRPNAAATARRMNDMITYVDRVLQESMQREADAAPQGAGDAVRGASVTPQGADDAMQGADAASRDAEAAPQAPQILLIAPPRIRLTDLSYAEPYVRGDKSYAQVYYEEGQKLASYYRELAEYRGLQFADASSWELDFAYDGVHLSERGHEVFAQEMEKVLRQI